MRLNRYIDHTLLKAMATKADIVKLCNEAKEYDFYAVCVNGCYVELAAKELEGTDVKIAAVIGFPLGAMTTEAKVFEAKDCIKNRASEIDMVINIGKLLEGDEKYVEKEIRLIKNEIGENTLKVIFENCYLSKKQIKKASQLAVNAGADFVKTSTGFGIGGATFEDVTIMDSVVDGKAQIKAAGGIRDVETALKFIAMGVTRLGTSSGVSLITEGISDNKEY